MTAQIVKRANEGGIQFSCRAKLRIAFLGASCSIKHNTKKIMGNRRLRRRSHRLAGSPLGFSQGSLL
jgi:hypothetical protein